jgi:hypothetical protein
MTWWCAAGLGNRPKLRARLAYSVGFTITEEIAEATLKVPARAWASAYGAEGQVRPGAWVAEITGMLELSSWPRRHAGDRPQGTPASGRPAAVHRHRWRRPQVGSQTAAAAPVLRRRPHHPPRPPPTAAHRRDLALGDPITAALTRLQALAPG